MQPCGPYHLTGYSFGACIAFEMALQLQQRKEDVELSLLDGSHAYITAHTALKRGTASEEESKALCAFILQFCPMLDYKEVHAKFLEQKDSSARLSLTEEMLKATKKFPEDCQITKVAEKFYQKLLITTEYEPKTQLQSNSSITLIKAEKAARETLQLGDDYGLGKVVEGHVKVVAVPGNHISFIQGENARVVASIIQGKK